MEISHEISGISGNYSFPFLAKFVEISCLIALSILEIPFKNSFHWIFSYSLGFL